MAFDLQSPESKAAMVLHYFLRGLALLDEVHVDHAVTVVRDLRRIPCDEAAERALVDSLVQCAQTVITPGPRLVDDLEPAVVIDQLRYAVLHLDLLDEESLRLIADHCASPKSGQDDPTLGAPIRALGDCCALKLETFHAHGP